MASTVEDPRTMEKCGRPSRQTGKPCGQPAGHGVKGVNSGPCKRHGGALQTVRMATMRRELLADAQAWATDHDADPTDLMLAEVRATSAHAAFVDRLVMAMHEDGKTLPGDIVEWHKLLDRLRRTAAETSHRAIALGLEERRVRMVERLGGVLSASVEAMLVYFAEQLGDALTPEIRQGGLNHLFAALESFEGQAVEELPALGAGA
jgi:hypothetical protein